MKKQSLVLAVMAALAACTFAYPAFQRQQKITLKSNGEAFTYDMYSDGGDRNYNYNQIVLDYAAQHGFCEVHLEDSYYNNKKLDVNVRTAMAKGGYIGSATFWSENGGYTIIVNVYNSYEKCFDTFVFSARGFVER